MWRQQQEWKRQFDSPPILCFVQLLATITCYHHYHHDRPPPLPTTTNCHHYHHHHHPSPPLPPPLQTPTPHHHRPLPTTITTNQVVGQLPKTYYASVILFVNPQSIPKDKDFAYTLLMADPLQANVSHFGITACCPLAQTLHRARCTRV